MREYELVYITQPQFSQTQLDQLNNRLKTLIEKDKGHLFYARSLGQKKLAYRINKQSKGTYYSLCYAANGVCNTEIERLLRFDENVLRFLTVLKNEKVDVQARAAEIEARGESAAENEQEKTAAKNEGEEVKVKEEVKAVETTKETTVSEEEAASGKEK